MSKRNKGETTTSSSLVSQAGTYIMEIRVHVVLMLLMFVASAAGQTNVSGRKYHFDSVIGRDLYACADSGLYARSSSDTRRIELGLRLGKFSYPRLRPLRITEAVVVSGYGGFDTALFVLSLPNGKEAVAKASLTEDDAELSGDALFQRMALTSGLKYKDSFSPADVQNIQIFRIEVEMNEEAVICALGRPDRENDYGTGGRQLVFDQGKTIVYIDSHRIVTNIQKFPN